MSISPFRIRSLNLFSSPGVGMENNGNNSCPDRGSLSDHSSTQSSVHDSAPNSDRDSDHGSDHNPGTPSDCGWVGFCVPRQCRLCTYPIEPNEWMVATDFHGEVSSVFTNNEHSVEDVPRLKEEFRPCPPACAHDQSYLKGCVPGYHAGCFNYAGNPRYDLLSVTAFSFEPMPSYSIEREKRMAQLLATKIGSLWCRLPRELCLLISEFVVREYTIATLQGLYTVRHKLYDDLDPSQSIWVRYIDIGGYKYVCELSNRRCGRHSQMLHDPETAPHPIILYVLEDHLGVRDLLFQSTENSRMNLLSEHHEPGSWWRTIPSPHKLHVEYDGVKLRRIENVPTFSSNLHNMTLSVPLPLDEVAALKLHCRPLAPLEPEAPLESLQMVPFRVNGPGITGYSFCWSEGLYYLHTHYQGEDNLALYKDFDILTEDPLWMHLPVAPDEYIDSIWFRRAAYTSEIALWIVTNKGNDVIAGPTDATPIEPGTVLFDKFPNATIEWSRLIGPLSNGQPVQTYFNLSNRGLKVFATLQPNIANTPGPEPPSWLRSAYSYRPGSSFAYVAHMANVAEIIACRKKATCLPRKLGTTDSYFDWWGAHSPIIGLTLVYTDGTRILLGQWRMDSEILSFDIQDATTLHMAFRQAGIKRNYPYLSEIRLSAPSTPTDPAAAWRWLKIDLCQPDYLQWWTIKGLHSGSHMAYGDQTTYDD
ncbi:hypothetical protein QBC41DRAFT_313154 [Cercophora samala]|uniref:Uncharacterized protein n=1 Tax=Cercophora samala TaxID=330535 RepID=A0AA40DGH4_9PEZI|nr:hypothetical protein QBC41DRAFT_313154 [Cercophora samala]